MIQTKLKGMGVALITPFKEDESVDYDALMRMVDYLLQNNADFYSRNTDSYRRREENHQKDGD